MSNHSVYDYMVIGSGFGGSVSAMRLSEKGYRVGVIEKGKRFETKDFPKSNWQIAKFLWAPIIRCFGIQKLTFFKEVFVLSGVGVGGGSLVYANTHMIPSDAFFTHPVWSKFGDWKSRLAPFYALAQKMLGTTKNPTFNEEDELLLSLSKDMGRADTFSTVDVGVYFGDTDKEVDPYFNGLGPLRKGCTQCAGCMVGCRHNAKNTLDKNYLWFAEKFGATIFPETVVEKIEFKNEQYYIHTSRSTAWWKKEKKVFVTKGLVISGGVLGTMELLLKQKFHYKTLPNLSDQLGQQIRTNSESLCGIHSNSKKLNHGIAISSVFNPDENTHVEIVKYPDGADVMGVFSAFAVGPGNAWVRSAKFLGKLFSKPHHLIKAYYRIIRRKWATHTVIFLVMQSLDNAMSMEWKKNFWGNGKMSIKNDGNNKVPAYIEVGQKVMTDYAKKADAVPANSLTEILFNMSTTAHILGGIPMGNNKSEGVINEKFQVFGYPNLYVLDGSVIQGNLGVNPSLTITAISEYAMSLIPKKEGDTTTSLEQMMQQQVANA